MRQHRAVVLGPKLLPQARRRSPALSHVQLRTDCDDHDYSRGESNEPRIRQMQVHRNLHNTKFCSRDSLARQNLVSCQYQTFALGRLVTIARLLNQSRAHRVRGWNECKVVLKVAALIHETERFCPALPERMSNSGPSPLSGSVHSLDLKTQPKETMKTAFTPGAQAQECWRRDSRCSNRPATVLRGRLLACVLLTTIRQCSRTPDG